MVGGAARLVSAWYVLQFANRRHCVASYLYLIGGTELADPRARTARTEYKRGPAVGTCLSGPAAR